MLKAKFFFGSVILILSVGFTALGCSGSSPSNVVRQFWISLEKADANGINRYTTHGEATDWIRLLEKNDYLPPRMWTNTPPRIKDRIAQIGSITYTEEVVYNNDAYVTAYFQSGITFEFTLAKVNGRWTVIDFLDDGEFW